MRARLRVLWHWFPVMYAPVPLVYLVLRLVFDLPHESGRPLVYWTAFWTAVAIVYTQWAWQVVREWRQSRWSHPTNEPVVFRSSR